MISKTYQRDDVRDRDRQHNHFQISSIFVARRTNCCASHVALDVALVCGQSRHFRICRYVPRRVPKPAFAHTRIGGVFCT